jgi:2-oxoisovalerate dehydrogenase E2 component (dihydrolipoyl transacylase)
MSEVKQFRLPDVGEGLTEADIVAWHVKQGDRVTVNQVIVEIETAKAVVELPCPFEGVVTGLLVDEGATVDVGTPIIAVDVAAGAEPATTDIPAATTPAGTPATPGPGGGADGGTSQESPAPGTPAAGAQSLLQAAFEPGLAGSPAPKVERQAVLVGYGVKLGPTKRRQRKGTAAPAAAAPATAPPSPAAAPSAAPLPPAAPSPPPGAGRAATAPGAGGNGQAGVRPAAKPPVRKLARDLGVDLAGVVGTGPDGVITREDVEAAGHGPAAPAAAAQTAPAGTAAGGVREERIAVKGVRKHTAAAVVASAFTAPHVTEFLQVDVTATMEAVQRLRALPEFGQLRPSPLLLVAKALLLAVARHPVINSTWDEDAQEIVVRHYVNLGIAAATDRGLLVPNIKDAHTLSLPGLAAALTALAATAREGKTQPADMTGGTITITNVGVFGVDAGTPILTPGEAAILAFGQVKQAPWVHEGELAVRQVTTLSLSFDHRIVDGDLGSAVLRDVGAMLADPVTMLAWG